jgi:hypothetical protein
MNKHIQISSMAEIERLKAILLESSVQTRGRLIDLARDTNAADFLTKIRFGKVGCDPLDKKRHLNIVEQLNQMFTYLASLLAVECLLDVHPEAIPFTLNLGTSAGSDIQSSRDGGIVAEVFSTTNRSNNQKLKRDIKKIAEKEATHKYVFFMCPEHMEGKQKSIPQYPDVTIWALSVPNAEPEHKPRTAL